MSQCWYREWNQCIIETDFVVYSERTIGSVFDAYMLARALGPELDEKIVKNKERRRSSLEVCLVASFDSTIIIWCLHANSE